MTKRGTLKNIQPNEHLKRFCESTFLERLNWLEEANIFYKIVSGKKNPRLKTANKKSR